MNPHSKSLLEEEFKKRRARVTFFEQSYRGRGHSTTYFKPADEYNKAIVKIIHHRGNVRDLIRYVADEKKTGNNQNICSSDDATLSAENLKNKERFWQSRNKANPRANARHSTHIVLSTKEAPTPDNISKLKEAVSIVASENFSFHGYDCFFAVHTDTPHLHAHLIIHNKNLITGKSLRFSKHSDLYDLRKDFADNLNRKGWRYTCRLRKDSMKFRDGIEDQKKH